MARPASTHSRLYHYTIYLTVEEKAEAVQLARDLGTLNERGEPSLTYLFLKLIEEEKLRQQEKNPEKIPQKKSLHD